MKSEDHRLLEPLLRLRPDLDSGTRKDLARATVKVRSDERTTREQEAVLGRTSAFLCESAQKVSVAPVIRGYAALSRTALLCVPFESVCMSV